VRGARWPFAPLSGRAEGWGGARSGYRWSYASPWLGVGVRLVPLVATLADATHATAWPDHRIAKVDAVRRPPTAGAADLRELSAVVARRGRCRPPWLY
jgi:hypothetical protein